jgi:hypothetical protein
MSDDRHVPLIDVLYRCRWWTSAMAATLVVFVVPDHRQLHSVSGIVATLLWVLVWVPIGVRWSLSLAAARSEFRREIARADEVHEPVSVARAAVALGQAPPMPSAAKICS